MTDIHNGNNKLSLSFVRSRVKLVRICLHSTIDPCQNVLAMAKTPPGVCMRKIILATNIAESSITVPDVKYGKLQSFNAFAKYNSMI